jgi:hypothetical protein
VKHDGQQSTVGVAQWLAGNAPFTQRFQLHQPQTRRPAFLRYIELQPMKLARAVTVLDDIRHFNHGQPRFFKLHMPGRRK